MLASLVAFSTVTLSDAKVETLDSTVSKEYIVLAKNDVGYDKVEDNFDVNKELSEDLEDDNIVIATMTKREAQKLERDKNILLVEEDITLEGSDYEAKEDMDLDMESQRAWKLKLKEERANRESVDPENQWNIDAIGANASEYSEGSDNVKVAIIDSGVVASTDIDIDKRVNFIDDIAEPLYEDVSGHGTSVASIIAGKDNGYGVTGINPNAKLYSLRVLDNKKKAPLSRIVNAIYWCIDNDIDIINMSFGTTVRSEIFENAIKDADRAGILMIAAAGNRGETSGIVEYPAAFDEVVAVGAMTPNGDISNISSMGDQVELLAPGESVPVTDFYDEVVKTDGTSVAAPHITGVASVLLAKDNTKSPKFIRELMKASSKNVDNAEYGVVDLDYALDVYDEFSNGYTEDAADYNEIVEDNTDAVKIYDDAEVEALWSVANHQAGVNASSDITSSVKNVFNWAQYCADNLSYLSGSVNSDQGVFHGTNNYIANYMYLMRIARKTYNNNMDYALANATYPYSNNDSEAIIVNRLTTLKSNFSSVMSSGGISDTNQNRGRFIAGLAVHTLMDAYAHRAYAPSGSSWAMITNSTLRDDTTYIPARYNTAKAAALDAICVWHYAYTPDALEFYQPDTHGANVFKMHKFNHFVSLADPSAISDHPQWYANRSAGS